MSMEVSFWPMTIGSPERHTGSAVFCGFLTSDGRGVAAPVRGEKESSVTTSPKPQGAAADIRGG